MNLFRSTMPKWAKNIDKEDKQLLKQLQQYGADFMAPREMNFSTYAYPSEPAAREAVSLMQSAGWHTVVRPQADNASLYVIDATKPSYVIAADTFAKDKPFFEKIAKEYGGQYDGWFASV